MLNPNNRSQDEKAFEDSRVQSEVLGQVSYLFFSVCKSGNFSPEEVNNLPKGSSHGAAGSGLLPL